MKTKRAVPKGYHVMPDGKLMKNSAMPAKKKGSPPKKPRRPY